MTLTFKIQLRNIHKPTVWRRLEVPGNFTFDDLHHAIQKAFEWEDYHLYQFQQTPYDQGWSVAVPNPDADFGMERDTSDARQTLLDSFLRKKDLTKFVYVYDFGDDWVHDITLERRDDSRLLSFPVCKAGKGACPPEDCGGPWGYEDMKHLLKEEPESEEAQEYVEWLGLSDASKFDADKFDIDHVNLCLKSIKDHGPVLVPRHQATTPSKTAGSLDFHQMIESFQQMLSKMSDDDKQELSDLFQGKKDLAEVANERFYSYEKPDYAALASHELQWLAPFWDVQNYDDKAALCHAVADDAKKRKLTRQQMTDEMHGYMYKLFAEFDRHEPGNRWRLFGPLWMMEQEQMTECLDAVLEALRQDAYFMHAYYLQFEEWVAAALYQLAKDTPEKLESYLYEQGIMPESKPVVFMALVMVWLRQPQKRMAVTTMITNFLSHCLDICLKGASPMNLESYAITLATAHVKEALPILCRIFNELRVPTFIIDDGISEVEKVMNNDKELYRVMHDSIDGFLNDEEELGYLEDHDAEGYYPGPVEDDDDDIYSDGDLFDNIEGFYDITEKAKRLELLVEKGGKMRMLQVPSNMTFDGLMHLITLVFNLRDFPENYEFKDSLDFRYLSDADDHALDDDYWEMDGTSYSTVSEVFRKKGDTAVLRTRKGKRCTATYHLRLEKSGRYGKATQHYTDLLWSDEKELELQRTIRTFDEENPFPWQE